MPRTARTTRGRLPVPTDDAPPAELTTTEPERITEIDELVASILPEADRFSVQVFRKPSTGENAGRAVYLSKMGINEFSLDTVRERHGGGTYELRFLRADERGVPRIHRSFTQAIAGAPRVDVEPATALPAGGPVAVVAPPPSSGLEIQLAELRAELRALRQQPPPAQPDLVATIAGVLGVVKQLTPTAPPPSAAPSVDHVLQFVRLGIRMAMRGERPGGGGDSGDAVSRLLDRVTDPLVSALTAPHNAAPAAHAPNGAPRVPAPGHAPEGPGMHTAKLVPVWLQNAAPYFPALENWARSGDDPHARARMVLGVLSRSDVETLGEAATAPDFVASTLAVLPPVFREPATVAWATQFLQALETELTEPDENGGADAEA